MIVSWTRQAEAHVAALPNRRLANVIRRRVSQLEDRDKVLGRKIASQSRNVIVMKVSTARVLIQVGGDMATVLGLGLRQPKERVK